ncbi:hypothetical protein BV898_00313 [Hypsibius exemplaris]|uniref:SUEL-type lectin domain-containing protein n=1 Tax=Hypsibius exemplaris TaxID=2072580 RepID=A0A1W0XFE4_HYPEX|nr:hypothetical protein BV898_00313 [Hypsibius exemplaris]
MDVISLARSSIPTTSVVVPSKNVKNLECPQAIVQIISAKYRNQPPIRACPEVDVTAQTRTLCKDISMCQVKSRESTVKGTAKSATERDLCVRRPLHLTYACVPKIVYNSAARNSLVVSSANNNAAALGGGYNTQSLKQYGSMG